MAGHLTMRSGNPALTADTFGTFPAVVGDEAMTIAGTVNKTALSLVILLVAASYVWSRGAADPSLWTFTLIGVIGGLLVAMATIFKQTWAPYTTPLYAGLEGLALGGISVVFETTYPGIVSQAVFLTFGTLGALLMAYRVRRDSGYRELQVGRRGSHRGDRAAVCPQLCPGLFWHRRPADPLQRHVRHSFQRLCRRDRCSQPCLGFRFHRARCGTQGAETHGVVRGLRVAGDARLALFGDPSATSEVAVSSLSVSNT